MMPSSWMVPQVGESRQPRICINVDFPLPDGPMIEMNSPSSMSSVISSTPGYPRRRRDRILLTLRSSTKDMENLRRPGYRVLARGERAAGRLALVLAPPLVPPAASLEALPASPPPRCSRSSPRWWPRGAALWPGWPLRFPAGGQRSRGPSFPVRSWESRARRYRRPPSPPGISAKKKSDTPTLTLRFSKPSPFCT